MRSRRNLHKIDHEINVIWRREPNIDPIRPRVADIYPRIGLQSISAVSNDRPGQPDLNQVSSLKVCDLFTVHPIGEVVLEHGWALDHTIESGDRVSQGAYSDDRLPADVSETNARRSPIPSNNTSIREPPIPALT
jgi:hypothetical protein